MDASRTRMDALREAEVWAFIGCGGTLCGPRFVSFEFPCGSCTHVGQNGKQENRLRGVVEQILKVGSNSFLPGTPLMSM